MKKERIGGRRWERLEGLKIGKKLFSIGRPPPDTKTRISQVTFGAVNTASSLCLCAGVSPLGGSKAGFGECRSSIACYLAKSAC